MPKGKYKRLECHKNILKKNLKHKKLNLREAEKLRFRYKFKKLLRERIKNINITDDKLDELISAGKTYSEVKRKIPRIEDYTPPMWHLWVYGGHWKDQLIQEKIINKTKFEKIVNYTKKELKEKMLKILKERGQNPKDWNFEKWFKTVVI